MFTCTQNNVNLNNVLLRAVNLLWNCLVDLKQVNKHSCKYTPYKNILRLAVKKGMAKSILKERTGKPDIKSDVTRAYTTSLIHTKKLQVFIGHSNSSI